MTATWWAIWVFPGPELSGEFGDRLRFDAAPQQFVERARARRDPPELLAPLEKDRADLEAPDVRLAARVGDDLLGHRGADLGRLGDVAGRRDRELHQVGVTGLPQLLGDRRPDAGEVLERDLAFGSAFLLGGGRS